MRPGRSPFPDLVGLYSDEATAVTPTEVTAEAASAGPSFSDFTGLTSSEDEDIAAIRERYFQSLNLQCVHFIWKHCKSLVLGAIFSEKI